MLPHRCAFTRGPVAGRVPSHRSRRRVLTCVTKGNQTLLTEKITLTWRITQRENVCAVIALKFFDKYGVLCSAATRDAVCAEACVKPQNLGSVRLLRRTGLRAENRVGQAAKHFFGCFLEPSVDS